MHTDKPSNIFMIIVFGACLAGITWIMGSVFTYNVHTWCAHPERDGNEVVVGMGFCEKPSQPPLRALPEGSVQYVLTTIYNSAER